MAAKAATEMTSNPTPAPSQVQRTRASTLSDPATSEVSAAAVKSPTATIATAAGTTARGHPGLPGRLARLSITGAVPPRSASVVPPRSASVARSHLRCGQLPLLSRYPNNCPRKHIGWLRVDHGGPLRSGFGWKLSQRRPARRWLLPTPSQAPNRITCALQVSGSHLANRCPYSFTAGWMSTAPRPGVQASGDAVGVVSGLIRPRSSQRPHLHHQ
jgi:hypothetical protein